MTPAASNHKPPERTIWSKQKQALVSNPVNKHVRQQHICEWFTQLEQGTSSLPGGATVDCAPKTRSAQNTWDQLASPGIRRKRRNAVASNLPLIWASSKSLPFYEALLLAMLQEMRSGLRPFAEAMQQTSSSPRAPPVAFMACQDLEFDWAFFRRQPTRLLYITCRKPLNPKPQLLHGPMLLLRSAKSE